MSANLSVISEPQISFQHAALKVIWASQLIHRLEVEIARFVDRKPYSIRLEPDPDGQSYLLKVDLIEHIPHTIPCLIGDICHNLRASADFCWMGLRRASSPNPSKDTFPVSTNAKGLETSANRAFKGETLQKIKSLLVDRIKPHRDFAAGGSVLFSELNDLSNWQKHNMLVPVFAVTQLGDNTIVKSNDGSMIDLSGAKVSGRVAGIGGTHAEMTYDSEPTVEVFVRMKNLGTYRPLVVSLLNFHEMSRQIVKAFCEAFPSSHNPIFE